MDMIYDIIRKAYVEQFMRYILVLQSNNSAAVPFFFFLFPFLR